MNIASRSDERLVHVPLGERAYDILIGPGMIGRAGGEITSRLKGRRAAIVTDENVAPLYLEALMDSLQTDGIEAVSLTLRPARRPRASIISRPSATWCFRPVSSAMTR